ncbi:hypothetical protein [Flavobacterium aciduliphilum]|uniref:Intein n=1 Tax=Flavobacterium aciduliphilum TaxID=1101402 RepID=A0A328YLN7_9FLAO|nr:hypothetical protein [Flavobacterium aciduliphilum]RAR74244.1 hypothetical protein CLV55_102177 [Flavobacterium aciduliphilum]
MKKLKQSLSCLFLFIGLLTYSQSYELKEENFDIESVILNSTSLTQIMAKINFSFEQKGEKKRSDDGAYVTVQYKNESLITPLVTYTSQGEVTQIIFLMPKINSDSIGRELIRRYGTKVINGKEVIQRGYLTYDIRSDGDIGIFIIK